MYEKLYELISLAYANFLRDLLKKAINDPSSDIDDTILGLLDHLFGYREVKSAK